MTGCRRSVIWSVALAYGVFTVILYGLISIGQGLYFKKRSEKEDLELQLGMCLPCLSRSHMDEDQY